MLPFLIPESNREILNGKMGELTLVAPDGEYFSKIS